MPQALGMSLEWLRHAFLKRVPAPEGGFISFERPKETNQRKGRPMARRLLRFSLHVGRARQAIPGLTGELRASMR
jgi:hypothetical protein